MKISTFRSFLMITAAFFTPVHSESLTWFDAQERCASQNKILPIKLSPGEWKGNTYWMGHSQRKSNWIQLLGCYPDTEVYYKVKEEYMSIPSVGMCQEICASYSTFAVKFPTCSCLLDFPAADQGRLPTNYCYKSCEDTQGQPFTKQCGGDDAYNVYRSTESMNFTSQGEGMCLSIQCADNDKFYRGDSCSRGFYAACREKATSVREQKWGVWKFAMEICEQYHSSYLLGGNFSLTNVESDCRKIANVRDNPTSENWIAVARQIYTSIDQGYNITNKDNFISCMNCNRNSCSNVSCIRRNKFICHDKVDTFSSASTHSVTSNTELSTSPRTPTISANTENTEFKTNITSTYHSTSPSADVTVPVSAFTISSDADTSTHHSSSSSLDTTTTVSRSVEKNVSDQKEIVAAIVTPIVVLFGAVIVFGVIYFRRCKGNAASKSTKCQKPDEKNLETNQYIYVDSSNNNYFVLEPGSRNSELDNTTKSESESPYNDLPEGEYDLLRDKDSRKKVLDDTYATSAKASDYSDYDVTNRNRQTDEDSTYDHAGSNISSVYGYGSVHHQELDENPYSKTEY